MAHRKVSIYVYGKTPDGNWKYLKLANGTNNKIRPGFGLIRGTATKLDSYRYVLNVSGKWIPVGDTPKEAQQAAELKQAELAYVAVGGEVQEEKSETAQAAQDENHGLNRSVFGGYQCRRSRTQQATTDVHQRQANPQRVRRVRWRKSPLRYVEEVTANDVKQYVGWVIDHSRTNSRRTGENKFIRLKAWLVWAKQKVVTSKDAPIVPQKTSVHVLSDEVLAKFFAKCTDVQRMIYTTFLQSGMRDEELMYLERTDLHWNDGSPFMDLNENQDTTGFRSGISFARFSFRWNSTVS